MRTRLRGVFGVAGLLVVLVVAGTALGQDEQRGRRFRPGGFGFGGFGRPGGGDLLGTLRYPEVRDALKLTDDERAYIELFSDDLRQRQGDRSNLRESLRGLSREEMFERFREMARKRNEEIEKQLTEIIGKERVARLQQIQLQLQGPMAVVMNRELSEKLGIGDDQRGEIFAAMREAEQEVQPILHKKQQEKLDKVLNSSQKKKWKEMIGEPIDFTVAPLPRERRRGEGRGEGGRRRGGDRSN
jgi:hypothetical protein